MGSTYRYPFPPYPDGWYLLCESSAIDAGDVVTLRYFGRDLVVYRTAGGRAVVVGAHCPHMGAHLGVGGTVDGEGIRCPFHHWRYDADGTCVDVPYTSASPPKVCLTTWEICETSGLVMVWFSESGRAPTWQPPSRPEFGAPGWLGYETAAWTIRMHVQELAENIPDMAHFEYIHEVGSELRADAETDGHVYRQRSLVTVDGAEHEFTRQEASGLGLVWLETRSDPATVFLTATTPIDEEHVELRLLFLVNEGVGATELSARSRAMVESTVENTGRDVPIWENKVYVERAPLVTEEAPIRMLRKWARQFYAA